MFPRLLGFIHTFCVLSVISLSAHADKYSDAVCDGACPSSNPIDGVIALLVITAAVFFGTPKTKLLIFIWLGIPFLLIWSTGNAGWVIAFVPTFFLAMYFTDPIAKHFGWEKPDTPQAPPLDTNKETKSGTHYVRPVNNTHVKEGLNSEQIVSEKKHALKGNVVPMTDQYLEKIREEANQYRKAAEQGDANAQCILGKFYCNGIGVDDEEYEEADELAVYWFRQAAEQGDETGQFLLGQKIDTILQRSVDYLELTPRASNCLKEQSIFIIGDLIQHTESDLLLAPKLDRKSINEIKQVLAEHNLSLSMDNRSLPIARESELFHLGQKYELGEEVVKNHDLAMYYYCRAALEGSDAAYERLGVSKDAENIKKCLELMADNWYQKIDTNCRPHVTS